MMTSEPEAKESVMLVKDNVVGVALVEWCNDMMII